MVSFCQIESIFGKKIQEVINLYKRDLSCVYKVSDRHLNVMESQQQNMKLVVQVLSNSMANVIFYFGQRNLLQFIIWKEVN